MAEYIRTLMVEVAENGGYVVQQIGGEDKSTSRLIGAYTTATDLINAMPEILGTDGLDVVVRPSISTDWQEPTVQSTAVRSEAHHLLRPQPPNLKSQPD